jgi:hypothetical protein
MAATGKLYHKSLLVKRGSCKIGITTAKVTRLRISDYINATQPSQILPFGNNHKVIPSRFYS